MSMHYLALLTPIMLSGALLGYWWLHLKGKKISLKRSVVPQWKLKDGVSALDCGLILDGILEPKDIIALYIDLAVRGIIAIRRLDDKKVLLDGDYILTKNEGLISQKKDLLSDFEIYFLDKVFGASNSIKFSRAYSKIQEDMQEVRFHAYQQMVKKGFFLKNPFFRRVKLRVCGGFVIFSTVVLAGKMIDTIYLSGLFALLSCGVILLLFSHLINSRTKKGVEALHYIEGLKMYLQKAQTRQMRAAQVENLSPFGKKISLDKFLPYAIALGLEKEWVRRFENVMKHPEAIDEDLTRLKIAGMYAYKEAFDMITDKNRKS